MVIKPFKAYRPHKDFIKQVAALPYDVVSKEEAMLITQDNPYSFLNIDKPEIHIQDPAEDERYIFASNTLHDMIKKGIFIQDEPSIYIYGLRNAYTSQYGIVCCVSCEDYKRGIIKKHETTRIEKEQDRIKHVTYCQAHTGPIFLFYKEAKALTEWIINYIASYQPINHFTSDDGVTHEIFQISQPQLINQIINLTQKIQSVYIADGHHRAAAAISVSNDSLKCTPVLEEATYFLAGIFPKDQLHIMSYQRIIKNESPFSKKQIFYKLNEIFEIQALQTSLYTPDKRHTFGMQYDKIWYSLTLRSHIVTEEDPLACLDVSILQKYVLEPLFQIKDPRNDKRIDFVGGVSCVETLHKRLNEDMDIAFTLYPTSIDELIAIADSDQLMPPKSTWFEPKLRSGIFIHKIE